MTFLLFFSSSKPGLSMLQTPGSRAFPRGSQNRSTFHSGQTRERRQPPFNGSGGAPLQTQDTSSVSQTRPSFFSKLSSKFSKRYYFSPHFSSTSTNYPLFISLICRVVTLPDSESEKTEQTSADPKNSRKDGLHSV